MIKNNIALIIFCLIFSTVGGASENCVVIKGFIGKDINNINMPLSYSLREGDLVDEDIDDGLDEEWFLIYPNGSMISLFTKDKTVKSIRVLDSYFKLLNDVRVGETLSSIVEKFPDVVFPNGTLVTLDTNYIALKSNEHRLTFIFDDIELSEKIDSGLRFNVSAPELQTLKVWGIVIE